VLFLPILCYLVALVTADRGFLAEERSAEDGREKVL